MQTLNLTESQFKLYVQDTTRRIMQEVPAGTEYLVGEDLLALSTHTQVNKFVLFQLYQDWTAHMRKLQHPYFDYSPQEVKQVQQQYFNTLSQHIRLGLEHLQPMVEKAVYNSLNLIAYPAETLITFFFGTKTSVSLAVYGKYANYFDDFDFILQGILAYHRRQGLETIQRDVFEEKMLQIAEIYTQKQGMTVGQYQRMRFESLTGVSYQKIQPHDPESAPSVAPRPASEPIPALRTPQPASAPIAKEAPVAKPTPVEGPNAAQIQAPVRAPVQAPVQAAAQAPVQAAAADQPARLADQFRKEGPSLNTEWRTQKAQSGSAKLSLELIPLHKQFQYLQKLFGGDRALFDRTLAELNALSSSDEAAEYLRLNILNRPDVNREDKVVLEFIQLVNTRFSA
jgi:hypothetical protein